MRTPLSPLSGPAPAFPFPVGGQVHPAMHLTLERFEDGPGPPGQLDRPTVALV